jgi:hypothetical protein
MVFPLKFTKDLILSTIRVEVLDYSSENVSVDWLITEAYLLNIFLFHYLQMQTLDDVVRYYRNTYMMLSPANDQLLLRYAQNFQCKIENFRFKCFFAGNIPYFAFSPCKNIVISSLQTLFLHELKSLNL